MPDREKVIKGLECCNYYGFHEDCPYDKKDPNEEQDTTCMMDLMRDALAMLKEQNGLMLALDQSNAVNGYLNAEVERLNVLLKEQEAEIRQLRLALDIAKGTCKGIKSGGGQFADMPTMQSAT